MKIFYFLIFLFSCGQNYNSNTNDKETFKEVTISATDPFYKSSIILKNNCFSCHSAYSEYNTDQQWVDAGLIIKGDFDNSLLKTKLKNYGGNMPLDPASPLSDSDVTELRNWVNSTP